MSLIRLGFKSLSFLNLSSGVEKYSFELDLLTKNSISIKSFLNLKKDKMFSNIYFKKMKLKVENEFSFNDQIKIGKSELVFNNTKKVAEYEITKNFFKFL